MPDVIVRNSPLIIALFSVLFYLRAYKAPHVDVANKDTQRAILFALYALLAAVI